MAGIVADRPLVGQTSERELYCGLDDIKASIARRSLHKLHVNAFCESAYVDYGRTLDLVDDVPRHVLRSRLIRHLLCDLLLRSAGTLKVFRLGGTEVSAILLIGSIG